MKRLLLFVIVLVISVFIGLKIKTDPGYLLLAHGKWTIEMPLWFGIIVIILIFLLLYWLFRFICAVFAVASRIKHWYERRNINKAHQQTNYGLIALTEGNWARAEKKLSQAADHSDTPLINYLAAARAAQEQGAFERRDSYL